MAGIVTPINTFSAPAYDYAVDLSRIERQRKLAEALQGQSLEATPQQTAGGYVVPNSPMQGIGKLAQALVGYKMQDASDQQQRDLVKKSQTDYADMAKQVTQKMTGAPAIPAQPPTTPNDDDGNPNPSVPATPAVAPDYMGAMTLANSHPMGAPIASMAMQLWQRDLQRKRLSEVLSGVGIGSPSATPSQALAAEAASGGAPGPTTAATARIGQPNGGMLINPLAMALIAGGDDPNAMTELAKMQQQAYMDSKKLTAGRPGAPVYDGNGNMVAFSPQLEHGMTLSPGGTASVVPGFADSKTALSGIPNPAAPMIDVEFDNGQKGKLTQPEYLEYQKSGQMPARYGQQPPAPAAPPAPAPGMVAQGQINPDGSAQPAAPITQIPANEAAAARAAGVTVNAPPAASAPSATPRPPAMGTPFLSQPQSDTIRQSGQQAANTEAGKEFISEMRQNYSRLRDVPATLDNIDHAKQLAAGEASKFMGPIGTSKLYITKFLRSNVPGMGNLDTSKVTSAEELQSTLFNQVMDNLKKMDASPSQYQQQVMQEAFGTLSTDPQSVPKILDVFADILKNRVAIHNETVTSAEGRGTTFPYDIKVKLPERAVPPPGTAASSSQPGSARPSRGASGTWAPKGVDQKLWDHMTPQERALWH